MACWEVTLPKRTASSSSRRCFSVIDFASAGSRLSLRRALAHQVSQRLIVRVNAPFRNQITANKSPPRRGDFPEVFLARDSIARVCAAGTAENSKRMICLKKLIGSNAIARDELEVFLPAFPHFIAAHEPLS